VTQCLDNVTSVGRTSLSETINAGIRLGNDFLNRPSADSQVDIDMSSPKEMNDLKRASSIVSHTSLENVGVFADDSLSPDQFVKQKRELEDRICRKEETLRKLNLVKMYRVKVSVEFFVPTILVFCLKMEFPVIAIMQRLGKLYLIIIANNRVLRNY